VTSEEERAFTAEGIDVSAKQLDAVIDDLNAILMVRRGLAEDKTIVYFREILSEVETMLHTQIANKGAIIEHDFSQVAEVETVRSFVRSIFFNLVSNSLKYSKDQVAPRITIASDKFDGRVLLTFTDNGLGIDLEKYGDRIFMLYKGFHPKEDARGLGLFMIKTQLESVHGQISVKSKVGVGTTFFVTI
jgi:signal transduction histidine kinase